MIRHGCIRFFPIKIHEEPIILNAKGKKDRVIPISDKVVVMLREYYKVFRPGIWLFEGQELGTQYRETSLQKVLKQALDHAEIDKTGNASLVAALLSNTFTGSRNGSAIHTRAIRA
jgi:site-specific recombinase XerD